jgi:chitodextrinase
LVTFCSHAYATNIFQLNSEANNINLTDIQPNHPQWSASSIYVAGDVVTHNNSLFIAAFWVKGIEPIENQPHWDGWIWLQNTVIEKWQANKVYQGGSLVKHGVDYYLARYWNESNEPAPHSSWQKIKDLFYQTPDLPPEHPDDYKTLDGVDQNDNGIRDDYERYVYEKFDSPQLITFSLGAASTLQLVIDIEQGRIPNLDAEIGKQIILDMINISYCVRYLQYSHPHFREPEVLYFNTIDRAYANRKSQNKISDYIAWDDDFHYGADRDCKILKL